MVCSRVYFNVLPSVGVHICEATSTFVHWNVVALVNSKRTARSPRSRILKSAIKIVALPLRISGDNVKRSFTGRIMSPVSSAPPIPFSAGLFVSLTSFPGSDRVASGVVCFWCTLNRDCER